MYHFVLWCIFRDFAVTLSFPDCYRWFSHIFNDTLRSVPSKTERTSEEEGKKRAHIGKKRGQTFAMYGVFVTLH